MLILNDIFCSVTLPAQFFPGFPAFLITGTSPVPSSYCKTSFDTHREAVIGSDGRPMGMADVAIPAGMDVKPGKTYEVVAQRPCGGDRLNLEMMGK